ncbi:transcriptional regulator [Bradyrhizobium elkanii]|uniref:transcriptional regulator n=1 Tax=Bradyrhizobium elkanii TaxID=29448 RepID=UPI003D1BAE86
MNQCDFHRTRDAISKAKALCGGSEASLARAAGYSQNAIWSAQRKGRVSLEMAIRLERATGGGVPRWIFRPDAFQAPASEPKSPSADSTANRASRSDPRPTPDIARSLEPGEAAATVAPAVDDASEPSSLDPSEVRA